MRTAWASSADAASNKFEIGGGLGGHGYRRSEP